MRFHHCLRIALLRNIRMLVALLFSLLSVSHACTCTPRPDKAEKAETARWMAHSIDWGTLSTIRDGKPFGNIYSFVDGPCDQSTGIPYLYGTYLDESFQNSLTNDNVSLTLSEAASPCGIDSCDMRTRYGDPESPMCARLTLSGKLVVLEDGDEEWNWAFQALVERHSSMATWPKNHDWLIAKIEIEEAWLIDYFGGPAILTAEEYFGESTQEDLTSRE